MNLNEWVIEHPDDPRKKELARFLKSQDLEMTSDFDYTFVLLDDSRIIATASLDKKVIKCVAVSCQYQDLGLMAKVISNVISAAYARGQTHLFVYTKPAYEHFFKALGFYEVAKGSERLVLLENKKNGIKNYLSTLKTNKPLKAEASAIVMNCNPFTLGHQYLVENVAKESTWVYIFLVSEDMSAFSTQARYEMLLRGTVHHKNVEVFKTEDYLISSTTFPTYFIKEVDDATFEHAKLDVEIFKTYFAKNFNIKKRYVGEEPFCKLTALYNQAMLEILPSVGIEVQVIPRKRMNEVPISASEVRKLIELNDLEGVKVRVPTTTYAYLCENKFLNGGG